jgi:hypothetical protein
MTLDECIPGLRVFCMVKDYKGELVKKTGTIGKLWGKDEPITVVKFDDDKMIRLDDKAVAYFEPEPTN